MGASIRAYLLINDYSSESDPPFTADVSVWNLADDIGLAEGKHYDFFAAISGVRNKSGITPLYPCRGLPELNAPVKFQIDADEPNVSWLTLSEIKQALAHMKIEVSTLDKSVEMVLQTMKIAEGLYGKDRIRLVFQIDD